MKVVAQSGSTEFLIHVGNDERGEPYGRVVDVEDGTVHRAFNVHSILARGYWEDPTISPNSEKALQLVKAAPLEIVGSRGASRRTRRRRTPPP